MQFQQFQYISAQAAVELHIPQEWRGLVSFNILQDGANVGIYVLENPEESNVKP